MLLEFLQFIFSLPGESNIGLQSHCKRVLIMLILPHKVHKTKWSHSYQPRQLPVSLDTLVPEENYLSHATHIWQGVTPKISAHVVRIAMSAEWDLSLIHI